MGQEKFSDLDRAGLVQMFEFTFELAWKTLQDLLFVEGFQVNVPREAIRRAFEAGYVNEPDTETMLDALQKRNLLSHTYEESTASEAEDLIRKRYAPALGRIHENLKRRQIA